MKKKREKGYKSPKRKGIEKGNKNKGPNRKGK
jgi:hypothetical protein